MDLFTAGLAESPADADGNPLVGPTFACVIGRQFKALMDGDRFFFTHGEMEQGRELEGQDRRGHHGGGHGHGGGGGPPQFEGGVFLKGN